MTFPRRGEIHLVDFDPSRGHEMQKTRPDVIIDLETAVQEQLGRRLQKTKGPFDLLVIDHIDKVPTAN
jgi:uncharacterized protein (TIGR03435 family)